VEKGDIEKALLEYSTAEKMLPENNVEMKYWHAVSLANVGRLEEALPLFKEVFQADSNWKTLTPRLVPIGLLEVSDQELQQILDIEQ
jgi:tetratricopeptide (TPR) repeat protein